MKKMCIVSLVFLIASAWPISWVEAGTFLVGAKYWYETTWDSAILDINDKIVRDYLETNEYQSIESEVDTGTGYLAGPVFGYQTTDQAWSFSFSPMLLSHFSQEIRGTSVFNFFGLDINGDLFILPMETVQRTEIDVTRRDYDLAVSRAFMKYYKVYFGLKYQAVDYKFTTAIQLSSFVDTISLEYDYEVYMPTIGLGFAYPFSEKIVFGAQAGTGLAKFSGLDIDDAIVFNGEANVSIMPIDNYILQLGYRYQEFSFDFKVAETMKTYKFTDRTYGPTLSLIYTF